MNGYFRVSVVLISTAFLSLHPVAAEDCNGNGIDDLIDIASGFSQDCNSNQVPDECDLTMPAMFDCDADGVIDTCEIDAGLEVDCNGDHIPDRCQFDPAVGGDPERDCNDNGILDDCDVTGVNLDSNYLSPLPATTYPIVSHIADVTGDGTPDIVSTNYTTYQLSVLRGLGGGAFAAPVFYDAGVNAWGLGLADFDGDNDLDAVVMNYGTSELSLLLNDGAGAFPTRTTIASQEYGSTIATGDFDNDSNADFAVAILFRRSGLLVVSNNTIEVYYGNGDGTFDAPVEWTVGAYPVQIAAADLNGDGRDDLITADQDAAPPRVNMSTYSVLLSNPGRTFTRTAYNLIDDAQANWVTTVDLDLDGDRDIVGTAFNTGLSVGINDGFGAFTFNDVSTPAGRITTGGATYFEGFPRAVEAVDLDADGLRDLVVANNSASLGILRNRGDGTLSAAVTRQTEAISFGLAVGQLDGAGLEDVLTVNSYSSSLSIYPAVGMLSLGAESRQFFGPIPVSYTYDVDAADMDNDGDIDLVCPGALAGEVSVRLANPDGTYGTAVQSLVGAGSYGAQIGDFDLDGRRDDVVATDYYNASMRVFMNMADGVPRVGTRYAAGDVPYTVRVADVTLDGWDDIVVGNFIDDTIWVYRNRAMGDGSFDAGVSWTATVSPYDIEIVDVNGDTRPDILVAGNSSGKVAVMLNDGFGGFGTVVENDFGALLYGMAVADFDQDNDRDIAVVAVDDVSDPTPRRRWRLGVILNNGMGGFGVPRFFPLPLFTNQIYPVDLDNDNKTDIAFGSGYAAVGVVRGLGVGNFGMPILYRSTGTQRVIARDLDSDGYRDLIASNVSGSSLTILRNTSADPANRDCNADNRPDSCNLADGVSLDVRLVDGIPDECNIFRGDMNCDGDVNFDDIDAFVTALVGRVAYRERFGPYFCNWENGDIDNDRLVTFDDIGGFVGCLVAGACP